jgi:hypothetical protein
MDTMRGTRVGSKDYTPNSEKNTYIDPTIFEGRITDLFTPYLIEEIPDGAWQTLQEKLGCIIRGIRCGKAPEPCYGIPRAYLGRHIDLKNRR